MFIAMDSEKDSHLAHVTTMESNVVVPPPAVDMTDFPPPSEEEKGTLRRVPDGIPWLTFVLCFVELAERASYYGVQTIFNNFMQFPLPEGGDGSGAVGPNDPNGHAGALGMGLQFASAFGILFTFLAYVIPLLGAFIADTQLGRYKTIVIGVVIGGVAHLIMIVGAAPSILRAGKGMAPFMVSFFLLAIGAGIFKPSVAPTVLDQYTHQFQYTKVLQTGEKVIVDPEQTIQRIMLVFYAMINLGSFFAIATTYTEKYVGFWAAFLEPGIVYFLLPVVLALVYKKTIKKPPMGSELTEFIKIAVCFLKQSKGRFWRKDTWEKVRPARMAEQGATVSWSDTAVDDVQRTLSACAVFFYFPIYNINDGGVGAVSSNQGAAMVTNGAPNDLLVNFNSLAIIAFTPFVTYILYPFLARRKIRFGPMARITVGFLIAATSGIIGGLVQWRVYATSPCGYNASTCDEVSPLSIWWQIPNVTLGAISEVFSNVTAFELAYVRAPPHLKAVVYAIFFFTYALSSALSWIVLPAIVDPYLIWAWCAPAIALFAQTAVFWYRHRHMDEESYINKDHEAENHAVTLQEEERVGKLEDTS